LVIIPPLILPLIKGEIVGVKISNQFTISESNKGDGKTKRRNEK